MQSQSPFVNKLDTNYVATAAEIPAVESWICIHQVVVDVLDYDLAELDQRRRELEESRRVHCDAVTKHRGLISCTRRIPADILSTIFSDLLRLEGPEASPYPAVTVSHVCRLWRDIVLDNPLLWTNLIVELPPYPLPVSSDAQAGELSKEEREVYDDRMVQFQRRTSNICDRLVAFAKRSAQCPLLFSLRAHDEHQSGILYEALDETTALQAAIDSIFSIALETCRRWETVRIHLRVNSCMPILLPLVIFAQLSSSNTRTLEFDLGYVGQSDISATWTQLNEKMHILRSPLTSMTARMTCTDIGRIEARWGLLTSLTLGLRYDGSNRLFESITNVLQRTWKLRDLTLEFTGPLEPVSAQGPPPQVCLQHLERLTVRGSAPSNEFAAALGIPTIKSLSFHDVIWTMQGGVGIMEWIRRYGRQLTHISIDYTYFSETSLVWILKNIPNVSYLRIHCFHATNLEAEWVLENGAQAEQLKINPKVLEMLTPKTDESQTDIVGECLCPRLERLAWTFGEGHGQRVRESLVELISSRRSVARGGSAAVSWLKEVDVVFVTGTTDSMLDELRRRGVDLCGVKLSTLYQSERDKSSVQAIAVPGLGGSVLIRGGHYIPVGIVDL